MNFKVKKLSSIFCTCAACTCGIHVCISARVYHVQCTEIRAKRGVCAWGKYFFLLQTVGWSQTLVGPCNESTMARQTTLFGTVVEKG